VRAAAIERSTGIPEAGAALLLHFPVHPAVAARKAVVFHVDAVLEPAAAPWRSFQSQQT